MKPISQALLTFPPIHTSPSPHSQHSQPTPSLHTHTRPALLSSIIILCASDQAFYPSWNTLLSVLAHYTHHLSKGGCPKCTWALPTEVFYDFSRFKHSLNMLRIRHFHVVLRRSVHVSSHSVIPILGVSSGLLYPALVTASLGPRDT